MISGNIAIIGGTGFDSLPPEIWAEPVKVDTVFGPVRLLSISNNYTEPYSLYFLARHGVGHRLAPHQINFNANIAALLELGVRYVFATNAVGSLRLSLAPLSLVLLDDFIDATRSRPITFERTEGDWRHTDFSKPYSDMLRGVVHAAASRLAVDLIDRATYVCCDGPRFETPAEIRMYAQWGGDVVGMTGLPEAIFAREAGLEYAALAMVTNYGAGLVAGRVDHASVVEVMGGLVGTARELLMNAAGILIEDLTQAPSTA